MRILLIEDDLMIAKAVEKGLVQSGFAVDQVNDGEQADHALSDRIHDLAVLDLGLPKKDGMAILTSLQRDKWEAASTAQWCKSMIKMISGIGIPTSQRRIGITFSFQK